MFDYQYAYLLGNLLILLPVWLILFWYRRDVRSEIWWVSLITGIIGPISELWYLQDYWRPETFNGWPIGIEDFLFGFFIGGISAVIYEEISGKRFLKTLDKRRHWARYLLLLIAVCFGLFHVLFLFGINSIYCSIITMVLMSLCILFFRRDLLVDSLVSGLFMGAIMFVAYIIFLTLYPEAIHRWWFLHNISGVLVKGIPLEELLWAFSWGMLGSTIYKFFSGRKFSKRLLK